MFEVAFLSGDILVVVISLNECLHLTVGLIFTFLCFNCRIFQGNYLQTLDFKYKHLKAVDSQHVDLTVSTSMGLHMFIMLVLTDLSKFKTKKITNK